MTRREAVARAIQDADSNETWILLTPRQQSGYFALADAALKAADASGYENTEPTLPVAAFEEEDESDKAQDFYELNGLR